MTCFLYFIYEYPTHFLGLTEFQGDPSSSILKNKEQAFDKHVAKLLQRTTTQPIMKAGSDVEMSGKDCRDILFHSTKVKNIGTISLCAVSY